MYLHAKSLIQSSETVYMASASIVIAVIIVIFIFVFVFFHSVNNTIHAHGVRRFIRDGPLTSLRIYSPSKI